MKTPERYYSPNDVMEILSVSRAEANRIMHEFEEMGKLFRRGRLLRVKASDFDRWVNEQIERNNERVRKERKKLFKMLATV